MREIYDHKKRKEHAEKRLDSANISSTNKRLLLEFLQEYGTDKNLSQSRKNKYLSNFKKTIELFGVDLDKASVSDARNFISKVQELDCSERTKEDYFVLLKVFYKWYKKHRKYSDSLRETIDYVCDYSYKINKNKMPEPDILTPDEVKTLISLQKTPRDRCLIAMLWDTGARIGELLTLYNRDVTAHPHGYKIHIQVSKTVKRTLTLIESSPYLRAYANQKGETFRKGNEPFFVDQFGKALTYNGVRMMLKRNMEKAQLDKRIYAHLFRHSRATYLADMGWSEQQLCKWFGWTIGSNMPRVYIKRSGIDVEAPMLKLQGIEVKDKDQKSEMRPLYCRFCGEQNEATNSFCKKCNKPLRLEDIQRMEQEKETMYDEVLETLIPLRAEQLKAQINTKDDLYKQLIADIIKELKNQ